MCFLRCFLVVLPVSHEQTHAEEKWPCFDPSQVAEFSETFPKNYYDQVRLVGGFVSWIGNGSKMLDIIL